MSRLALSRLALPRPARLTPPLLAKDHREKRIMAMAATHMALSRQATT